MRASRLFLLTFGVAIVGAACQQSSPPLALNDAASVENTRAVTINVLENDFSATGDLEVVETSNVRGGEVLIDDDGNVVFTPERSFVGQASFTYVASDGEIRSDPAIVVIDVDPGPDLLIIEPPILELGPVPLGSEDTRQATLTNAGFGVINLTNRGLDGDANAFSVMLDCPERLPPGASCAMTVTYTPNSGGPHVAVARFGEAGEVEILGVVAGQNEPEFSRSVIDFEAVRVGSEVLDEFTVTNLGRTDVDLGRLAVELDDAFFIADTDCADILPAGTICRVVVGFAPDGVASFEGRARFANWPGVQLLGSGTPNNPGPTPSRTEINFGDVDVSDEKVETLRISNNGPGSFEVPAPRISGTSSFEVEDNNCATTLAEDSTCDIRVAFRPTTAGRQTATLSLGSDLQVALRGAGLVPVGRLTATPSPLVFEDPVVVDDTDEREVTLTNEGPASLAVPPRLITEGSANFAIEPGACVGILAKGDSCLVTVIFRPTEAQSYNGILSVGELLIGLEGLGIPGNPGLIATPNPGLFPNTPVTAFSDLTITIDNPGPGALPVATPAVSGDAGFTMSSNNCQAMLDAQADCELVLRFTPPTGGTRRGLVTIGDLEIGLVGTGIRVLQRCVFFDDLGAGSEYRAGEEISVAGIGIRVDAYNTAGTVFVDSRDFVPGRGLELSLLDVILTFDVGVAPRGLSTGVTIGNGPNLIDINGDTREFDDLSELADQIVGDVQVNLESLGSNAVGIFLEGQVETFSLGGTVEFWMGALCEADLYFDLL